MKTIKYPEKTSPKFVEKIWGGRSLKKMFHKALPAKKSIGESWEFCGKDSRLVVKLIDVKQPLSIQVHPKGKSELWYIITAGKGSKALGGLTLKEYKLKKGMWVYIPSGTVHTIFPPAVLLEVSQDKLITYRLYDWGRKRAGLDIKQGLQLVNPEAKLQVKENINNFNCPYFKVSLLKYKRGLIRNLKDCLYFVLSGTGKIGELRFRKGDTLLVPKKYDLEILSSVKLFKITP